MVKDDGWRINKDLHERWCRQTRYVNPKSETDGVNGDNGSETSCKAPSNARSRETSCKSLELRGRVKSVANPLIEDESFMRTTTAAGWRMTTTTQWALSTTTSRWWTAKLRRWTIKSRWWRERRQWRGGVRLRHVAVVNVKVAVVYGNGGEENNWEEERRQWRRWSYELWIFNQKGI